MIEDHRCTPTGVCPECSSGQIAAFEEALEVSRDARQAAEREVRDLRAELDKRLPPEHYLAQLRQVAEFAKGDTDMLLAQLGQVLDQALDVVDVHQRLIDQRLEEVRRGR